MLSAARRLMLDDIIATWSRTDVLVLAGVSLLTTLLWNVPIVRWLFYPVRLLSTFVHELSHGLAAIATGGEFRRFTVHPNRSGEARLQGGNDFIVTSAGYLGPPVFGGGLILLSASTIAVQTILLCLAAGLALACVLFVRNFFGALAGLALAAGLGAAAWYLPLWHATLVFALLATQLPMAAINDLIELMGQAVQPADPGYESDAHVLARYTHIPAIIWAVLWLIFALGILVVTMTLAYRDTPIL